MQFDFDLFLNNIMSIVKTQCHGSQAKFNERIKDRDAITKWKGKKTKPSIDTIFKIVNEFNCRIDWLLTGKEQIKKDDTTIRLNEIEFYQNLRIILDSDDAETQLAIKQNLKQFAKLVQTPDDTPKKTGDPSNAASSGSGKIAVKKAVK